MREEAGIEVRPVGGDADARVVEVRPRQRIRHERDPEAHQNHGEDCGLDAHRYERQQEQERVAEADLGQRILERPVRLRPLERSQEDAEQHQGDAAPDRVHEQAFECRPTGAAARDRKRQRSADQERERRLDQIVERTPLPWDVVGVVRDDRPEGLAG